MVRRGSRQTEIWTLLGNIEGVLERAYMNCWLRPDKRQTQGCQEFRDENNLQHEYMDWNTKRHDLFDCSLNGDKR